MGKRFQYVSLRAMYHLMDGLSFKVSQCAEVLDHALVQFNPQTGIPDKIVRWNERGGNAQGPLAFPGHGRIIIDLTETYTDRGRGHFAQVIEKKGEKETAPLVFLSMHSLSLDIPMRVEVPLRALIKGGPDLTGTYSVYLHALKSDDGQEYVYYGITKRGWNVRFIEHAKAAVAEGSRRLFPQKLAALIRSRVAELGSQPNPHPKLAGIISAICAVGLDEDMALDIEEYLVDKYSLATKHPNGLNMIPGGREGIRVMYQLSGRSSDVLTDTESREAAFDAHLTLHPQLGVPKPGVSAAWNDPSYAEAVICGRDNRLSADQVREIRYLAATGWDVAAITQRVEALNDDQIRRVLAGRTYARIR
ncbi:TPA: hypothetical protein QDB04_001341 [Burkholderia vietnamiensis]|nr:hypothetical protein [Burkholderia vietnamiensis]